ncbi:Nn.00g113610.m01.CDS01 [Neocucurbitaria sp. VM-36]
MNLNLFPVGTALIWPFDLARLLSEKDILENGLADCVTYLHALRKKHARNERRLITSPSLPRKKRKKIQNSNRELEREIENRARDEQAFLNNLQACKANIFVATTLSSSSSNLSSVVPKPNSGSTDYSFAAGSEPTESSWNGWTNDAISPFQKQSNNPFFLDEVAPDDASGATEIDATVHRESRRPQRLLPYLEDDDVDDVALPVPPNTAQSHYLYSSLSPEAAVFEPYSTDTFLMPRLDRLSISPSSTNGGPKQSSRRRVTDAGFNRVLLSISQQSQPHLAGHGCHTWCNTTPQQSPSNDAGSWVLRRSRTASL